MSASPISDNACPRCGEELAPNARFCWSCGAPVGEPPPPLGTVPGPVVHAAAERRLPGVPARFVLLCLGFASFGAAIGLFATGSWAWGIVMVLLAAIVLFALVAAVRGGDDLWLEQSSRFAAERRAHAATTAEVWRTRLETTVTRWRSRSRLDALDVDRRPALQALGEAVLRGDPTAEHEARRQLAALEDERKRVEDELVVQLSEADERIRLARLPVQDTVIVPPAEAGSAGGGAADARPEDRGPDGPPGPSAPYPPPDEGEPPQPARVPEPYPPPDEGTPPTPSPDPGQSDSD